MKCAVLLLMCLVVLGAECAQHIILQSEDPAHPNQCFNEWENKYYKVGEVMKRNDKSCMKRVCRGLVQDTKMEIVETSCGYVKADGYCKKVDGDLKKEYPECCPVVKCPNAG